MHKAMCTEADLQTGLLGDTQINRSITNIVSCLHAENGRALQRPYTALYTER